ncbi:crossover junction endodeoxyribonuclease RuvC [candidate division WWE3 bacterium]|jgi:crossover junction endodeoxyribonuclease RuvC|uniref:Crossover junction endodeoxyribonuclease RuvC n=1 Tax=candidate division WWE3 bacterium TaxID=2053526 RepID=A0A928Y4X9_UNCKA|nr:crossover junction endodeoxyribonuclease RuvC [candidate division WWE3 bacterium]
MSFRMLGVDPGFGRTGLGIVEIEGDEARHTWHSVIDTDAGLPFSERLLAVRNDLQEAIRRFRPDAAAVESLFFQTNAKTAMKVGMARGVILLALADAGIPIVDLTPNQVKQGIAGWGGADKRQVQAMVTRLLVLPEPPKPDDAADALALAIVGGSVYRQEQVQAAGEAKKLP